MVSTPLKNMTSSVGSILPNMWKVIKFHGSKSPTRRCSMVTQGFQPHSTPASPQSGETRQSLRADSCRTEGNRRAESQFTNHTGITRYNGITFPANLEMWLFTRQGNLFVPIRAEGNRRARNLSFTNHTGITV